MDEETIVAANVQELVQRLNSELRRAHELKLKVHIHNVTLLSLSAPPAISVRIWKETELLRESPVKPITSDLGSDPNKWPEPFKSRFVEREREKKISNREKI